MLTALMPPLRRRLASCALALCLVQVATLFAAPVAACCATRGGSRAAATDDDCCPAGTHAPGQCPLHKAGNRDSACRFTCSHPGASALLLMPAGILAAPVTFAAPFTTTRAWAPRPLAVVSSFPDLSAPPPKA
jgi:hypothetical protein